MHNCCPQCESDRSTVLGTLGNVDVLRCRDCGWDWSEAVGEDGDDIDDDREDWDGQPDEAQEWHDFDPDC